MNNLPTPVRRYFNHVLGGGQPPIRLMQMWQKGVLRTNPKSNWWMKFSATHVTNPASKCFSWRARVRMLPFLPLDVRDDYVDGVGSGEVRLPWAITVASEGDKPEINIASLHRYLAEAVWCPTALLPIANVRWSPINDLRARATLTDRGNTVSLDFWFNTVNEVTAVYTSGRWNRRGKAFTLTPWEGHFSDYRRHQGILVPSRGEVGWYVDSELEIVWKGEVTALEYRFDGAHGA